jgi:antitoxin (DNA-binding transcriptional repressor) of toxin-antitoxin stability system
MYSLEGDMMRVSTILSTSVLVVALSLPSWAQVQTLPTHKVTINGTVETIDHARRVVNIKTSDGKFETIDVSANATRFSEVKVGDKVSITYDNNVSARLKPPGEADVDTGGATSTAGQQARPGGTVAAQRTMTATITAIDKSASSVSFEAQNGWKYTRRVADPSVVDKVKVGDKVDITWNTEVAIAVQ